MIPSETEKWITKQIGLEKTKIKDYIQRKDNKFMRTFDGNHKDEGTEETDIRAHGKKEMKG